LMSLPLSRSGQLDGALEPFRRGAARDRRKRAPRVVALGGGTGLPAVLQGLATLSEDREADVLALTGVVTVTDDGGSSGRLRQQLGVLPPGDVRNCLVALARHDSPFSAFLQHRFEGEPGIAGHSVGNLLLTALTQVTGDFLGAVDQLGAMIGARGRVLPTTVENVRLRAELESGELVNGETQIVGRRAPIRRLSLVPSPRPTPEVLQALVNADAIVVGPGSLYTSVLPNLLVEGVAATISGVDAAKIYVANLMTEPGETDGYTLDDHLRVIRAHTGFDLFDYILVNRRPIDHEAARAYAARGSEPIESRCTLRHAGRAQIIEADLAMEAYGSKIRHNPDLLARAILPLIDSAKARRTHAIAI
jgi:uncharacterized cofD-like protein